MDRYLRGGEEHPNVITENNVLAVLLYAQGKLDQVGERGLYVLSPGGEMTNPLPRLP